VEHAAPAALLGPRTHGQALGAGARRRLTLLTWGLAGGWAFMLGRGGGPSALRHRAVERHRHVAACVGGTFHNNAARHIFD